MAAALAMCSGIHQESASSEAQNDENHKPRILQVGLGGGSFPMYIHTIYPDCALEVCELDESIVKCARDHFGLSDALRVDVGDGLARIMRESGENVEKIEKSEKLENSEGKTDSQREKTCVSSSLYDLLIIDVNNCDLTIGMSFPPACFVTTEALTAMYSLLRPGGCLMLNLVARDSELYSSIMARLTVIFTRVRVIDVADQVNRIVCAFVNDPGSIDTEQLIKRLPSTVPNSDDSKQSPNLSSEQIEGVREMDLESFVKTARDFQPLSSEKSSINQPTRKRGKKKGRR
eukprot:213421_1